MSMFNWIIVKGDISSGNAFEIIQLDERRQRQTVVCEKKECVCFDDINADENEEDIRTCL